MAKFWLGFLASPRFTGAVPFEHGGDGLESEAAISYKTELTSDCMGIIHVGSGVVTGEDMLKGCRRAVQLVENTENFYFEVIDFTNVTELQIKKEDLDEISALGHLAAIFRPEAVVVIIAPRPELFEVGKKWQQRVQDLGWKTRIAHSRDEAMKWLRENYPTPPPKREQPDLPNESSGVPNEPAADVPNESST